MLKVIMFDLDGTLLPMEQELFTNCYFSAIAEKMSSFGYEPKKLTETIWHGTKAMVSNDGSRLNRVVFWETFSEVYPEKVKTDMEFFDAFYYDEFDKVKVSCGYNIKAAQLISKLKSLGIRLALATNPIFPSIATEKRVMWAGLDISDFEIYTTYDNSYYTKPNLNYYNDIINKLGVLPNEVLMVGNDVDEDMIAEKLGICVFLLTDNLINRKNTDISRYPKGSFDDLEEFIIERIK